MEQAPARPEAAYTAWHFFLAYCLEYLLDPRKLKVQAFEKLGTLPLEADIILLRKVADLHDAAKLPDFDFLFPYLALYTLIEYKSPPDRLTLEDLDKVRAYGMLCKLKYGLRRDDAVRILLLYSHAETDFFAACEQNGLAFEQAEAGIRACRAPAMQIVAMDLVALGERSPRSLVNLFSSRHQRFTREVGPDAARTDLVAHLLHAILRNELVKIMDPEKLKGMHELTEDVETIRRRFLQKWCTPEERLEGLSLEERLKGFSLEERVAGLSPEERLRGLSPEDLDRLRELLNRKN